jgi:hypothetical protein
MRNIYMLKSRGDDARALVVHASAATIVNASAPGNSQCPIAAVVSVISIGGEPPGGSAA